MREIDAKVEREEKLLAQLEMQHRRLGEAVSSNERNVQKLLSEVGARTTRLLREIHRQNYPIVQQ